MVLSPKDVALVLIDIQPGIIDSSHTQSPRKLKIAAETTVKIAALLDIPVFVSVVPTGSQEPTPIDELASLPTFPRRLFGALSDPETREAVSATGRKTLAIAGIATEVAVLHGALTAISEGYSVHVLVDCCGGLSDRTEYAAFRQLETAGAVLSSVPSFFTTLVNDLSLPEGAKMLGLLRGLMAKE